MNDRAIIELMLKRDESALERIAVEYGARLGAIAFAVTGDAGVAEECVNDAYLEAWNSIPPNEPYGYLQSYLSRIVRCKALDRMEKLSAKKRRAVYVELTQELEACLPSTDDTAGEAEARALMRSINAFLAELPLQKRNIFLRRYWFFDSVERIAELTGKSEGSVKMTLMRLRGKLRERLERDGFTVE